MSDQTTTPDNIEQNKDSKFPLDSYGSEINCTLSARQFTRDIWLFKYDEKFESYYLSGLYKDGFLKFCISLGYYKRYRPDGKSHCLIKDNAGIIEEILPIRLKDEVFSVENMVFEDLLFDYVDPDGETYNLSLTSEMLRETYLRHYHNILNDEFLEHLPTHEKPLLRDSRDHTYLFFCNTIIKVNYDKHEVLNYDALEGFCVWKDNIIKRDFEYVSDYSQSHFGKFLTNIAGGNNDRVDSVSSAIGYMINNYCDPSNTWAVIFYDEEITDLKKPEGGTGKGLVANALKQVRTVVKLDGKRFVPDDKFRWQSINESTQIVWVDDAPKKLGFEVFHSVITDGWNVEKKREKETISSPEQSPKLLLTSNSVVEGEGNTNERRQFIVEFAPYYSRMQRQGRKEPIRHVHGCTFFSDTDWDKHEWNMFYSLMVDCCQSYLSDGLIFYKTDNVRKNQLLQATSSEFVDWVEAREIKPDEEYAASDLFNDFKDTYFLGDDFKQRKFTDWLKKYAESIKNEFKARKSNGKSYFSFKSVLK